ncbi:MAG: SAVED domain-containing protein [Candidatus Cloacimonetes bacterium]|nr:SAVED domain-containing protein [Candidatus Cloacimonadota bacterium]
MTLPELVSAYLEEGTEHLKNKIVDYINTNNFVEEDWISITKLLFNPYSNKVSAYAWLALIAKSYQNPELYKLLNLNAEQFSELFQARIRKAYFPIMDAQSDGILAEVLIFPFSSIESKAICFNKYYQNNANIIAQLTGKSFLIIFTEDFIGNSWMTAASAALIADNPDELKDLCLSGAVNIAGKILTPAQLYEKKKFCETLGKKLITKVKFIDELEFWLNSSELPVPVIQSSGTPEQKSSLLIKMEAAIQKEYPYFNLQTLFEYTGLNEDDLSIFKEGNFPFNPVIWQDFLGKIDHFDRVEQKLNSRKALFWYAGMLSSLQFGIGAIFGFNRPMYICHWEATNQEYIPVLKLYRPENARVLKNVSFDPHSFTSIKYEIDAPAKHMKDLALILYFGSHNPYQEVISFFKPLFPESGILFISLKNSQGQINLGAECLRIVQETNSLLNYLKKSYHWQRLHIFQSSPNAICMALGIALGHFNPATVYHYQPQTEGEHYQGMYNLEMVKNYRPQYIPQT